MMKRIHILLMALLMGMLCHAQLLPTDSTRYGAKDPQKAIELYKLVFQDKDSPILQGNERMPVKEEFYIKFKRLADLAPYFNYYPYSGSYYEDSTSLYQRMLDSIADPAFKVMLVEDVVACGQMFVDHLDSINVVREWNASTKGNPLTMPLAKIKRAHYNYKFAHDPKYYPAHLYDKEKAYELYREAFKEFLDAKEEQGGKELEAYYVNEYYKVCEDLYKSDEEKYYEQFLADYQEIVQVCDKLLIPCYDDPDSLKEYSNEDKYKQYRAYRWAVYGIDAFTKDTIGVNLRFMNTGAASADRLKKYFSPRLELEDNRQNKEFLDNAIDFMYDNKFTSDSVFFEYCRASYKLGRTFKNCIGLATSVSSDGEKMREYYKEALAVAPSKELKAITHQLIAQSLFRNAPSHKQDHEFKQWEDDVRSCEYQLGEVLKDSTTLLHSSSLAVRNYVAEAYYMMGYNNLNMSLAKYRIRQFTDALLYSTMALEQFGKAQRYNFQPRRINGVVTNLVSQIDKLEKSIGNDPNTGKIYPGLITMCKNKIKEAKQNAAQQAAYAKYMEEKERERKFWEQGH